MEEKVGAPQLCVHVCVSVVSTHHNPAPLQCVPPLQMMIVSMLRTLEWEVPREQEIFLDIAVVTRPGHNQFRVRFKRRA